MERLTAFEFIAAGDGPQIVRLKVKDIVLAEFCFIVWIGVSSLFVRSKFMDGIAFEWDFERREDLVIEGQGIGRPYWNGEPPPWLAFDPFKEAKRIETIRAAAQREVNRALLSVQ